MSGLELLTEVAYFNWEQSQELARRTAMLKLIDYYQGSMLTGCDGSDHFRQTLSSHFRTQAEYDLNVLNGALRNLAKFIINRLSKVEKVAPSLEVYRNGEKDEAAIEAFALLADEMHLTQKFQTAERYKNLLQTSFLKFSYDKALDKGQRWHCAILTPATTRVKAHPGRPEIFEAVLIEDYEQSQNAAKAWQEQQIFWYWDKAKFRKLQGQSTTTKGQVVSNTATTFTELPIDGNEDGVNPYNLIPVVALWKEEPISDPILPLPDDLASFVEEMLVIQTANNSFHFMQGFGHLVFTGPEEALKAIEVKLGLSHILKIISTSDDPASITYLVPPDLLGALVSFEQTRLMQFAMLHGLSPHNFVTTADAWSAEAIHAENMALIEARQDDIPMHVRAWQQAYKVIARIANIEKAGSLPEDAELRVTYPELQMPQTREEKLMELQLETSLGLLSKAQAMMQLRPGLSEDEAKDKLKEIAEENAERFGLPLPDMMANLQAARMAKGDEDEEESDDQPIGFRRERSEPADDKQVKA